MLAGTNLNGNKGLVKLLQTVEDKVNLMKEEINDVQKDVTNSKFWGKLIATGVVMGLIGMFFKIVIK